MVIIAIVANSYIHVTSESVYLIVRGEQSYELKPHSIA